MSIRTRVGAIAPRAALLAALAAGLTLHGTAARASVQRASAAPSGLHVQSNHLVDGAGRTVRLLGVDRSGTEYACVQGWGIFDGPSDAASVQAMAAWHINAVRVPLNEDCWLGINGVPTAYSGANYRSAIANYVSLLNQNGLVAILDLHLTAPGSTPATGQQPMPDVDHAPTFWSQVASAYKNNSAVIFDLFNEPYPDNNQDTTAAWQCWRNGGTCTGVSYQAAGMQTLVNAVRQTGATNVVMLGGVQYSGTLSQWLSYRPSDPTGNTAAPWHSYNFAACNNQSCWNSVVAPVAHSVPLITGEIGENDCAHGYIDPLMSWLDGQGASYLGWTWDTWNCSSGPALITNYNGTPTNFGVGFQTHLAALAGGTPTPTVTAPSATPSPTATPAPSGFAFNRVAESASTIKAGSTETITATITTSQSIGNELVDFEVYSSAASKVWQAWITPVTFQAGKAQRFSARWNVPTTLPSGTYTLKLGVFTSSWSNQAWDDKAATFTVTP